MIVVVFELAPLSDMEIRVDTVPSSIPSPPELERFLSASEHEIRTFSVADLDSRMSVGTMPASTSVSRTRVAFDSMKNVPEQFWTVAWSSTSESWGEREGACEVGGG